MKQLKLTNAEKFTFVNLVRVGISFTYWSIANLLNYDHVIILLVSLHLFLSILWFVLIQWEVLIENNLKLSGFIPCTIDIFFISISNLSSGNSTSPFAFSYFYTTVLVSLSENKILHIYSLVLVVFAFSLTSFLPFFSQSKENHIQAIPFPLYRSCHRDTYWVGHSDRS
jgi:hypothetical protein